MVLSSPSSVYPNIKRREYGNGDDDKREGSSEVVTIADGEGDCDDKIICDDSPMMICAV